LTANLDTISRDSIPVSWPLMHWRGVKLIRLLVVCARDRPRSLHLV
jgi:hypothetical protein